MMPIVSDLANSLPSSGQQETSRCRLREKDGSSLGAGWGLRRGQVRQGVYKGTQAHAPPHSYRRNGESRLAETDSSLLITDTPSRSRTSASIRQETRQVPRLTEPARFCTGMVARPNSLFAGKPLLIGPPRATHLAATSSTKKTITFVDLKSRPPFMVRIPGVHSA